MNAVSGKKRNNNEGNSPELILDQTPVGIFTCDAVFTVTGTNQSFRKLGILYRLDFENIEGTNLSSNKIFNIENELKELKQGVPFEKNLNISVQGRKNVVLIIKGVPLFEEGTFTGGVFVLEDLSVSEKPAQEDLIKTADLEYALNDLNNFLFITDPTGIVRYAYGKDIRKFYTRETSPVGTILTELFPDSVRTILNEHLEAARNNRLSPRSNIGLKLGKQFHTYECRTEPLVNERGKVYLIFFVFNEITGYLSYAHQLESENAGLKQFADLLEDATDAVAGINPEGEIIFWNKPAEDLFGNTRDEVLNIFFGRVMGITKDYFLIIKDKLKTADKWETTLDFNNSRGEAKVINARFFLRGDNIYIVCRDITDKSIAELELAKSEEKFRNISFTSAAVIININPDGRIQYFNPALAEYLQMDPEEILNRNINSILAPSSEFPSAEKIQNEKSSSFDISLQGRRVRIDFLANINPVYGKGDTTLYFNLIGIDVTESKKKERDLEIFSNMLEYSRDGVALECQRNIILANPAFASIFGYDSADELKRRDILDLIYSSDILKAAEYFQSSENKDQPYRLEFIGKKKDGSTLFTEFTISSFIKDDKYYRMIVARDITERKRAQQSIRESEEKYRSITDNIDDFLYTYENKGRSLAATFYTNSVEKITGYNNSDFINDSKLFLKIVHPDDFAIVKTKLKSLFKSRLQAAEEFEFRIINKHGNIVWVRNKINIVRNADRRIQKIYGLVSDISLRKRAEDELKVSTGNLVKLNETKDKFISIISHDLRTPFTSILGFTDLLLNDETLSEREKRQYINFIRDSSQSMLGLVNSLLDWTRLQTGRIRFEPNRIDASAVIISCINSLGGAAFQKNIRLMSAIKKDMYIFADSGLLTQVFNNLISNAIKFTLRGGKIEIASRPANELRFMEFIVKDDGTGITPENMKKLFRVDTKFTSEGTAGEKGSGLGLSLVKEIIEKHGGKIWVNSSPGMGSEFHFTLPVAPATILLVDDSKTDKLLYSKIIKNITPDYNIEIASDGKEALDLIEKNPPALVISDHLMPVMNGLQFVQALKKSVIKGKPPVIILSSELDRHIIEDYTELGIEYVFQKPVNLISFKQAVEKSLRKGLQS
jgi:PAS domain S-box-containing protein